jgi:hypothetical protein
MPTPNFDAMLHQGIPFWSFGRLPKMSVTYQLGQTGQSGRQNVVLPMSAYWSKAVMQR